MAKIGLRFFPRTGSRCNILNDIKPLHPLIQEVAQGSFRQKQPPAIEGSGWVVKSLEASLWAFHDADTFEEAVLRAVNLGDDADTTGAICGQLAGAYWGESAFPESLRSGLARMDMLESALAGIGGALIGPVQKVAHVVSNRRQPFQEVASVVRSRRSAHQ